MTSKFKEMDLNTAELWHETYFVGRKYSHLESLKKLGIANLGTAIIFNSEINIPYEYHPSYRFFTGDDYGKFALVNNAKKFMSTYMKYFKLYFDSFKKKGYQTEISKISVEELEDGRCVLSDGNRRMAILMAISKNEKIKVVVDDFRTERSWGARPSYQVCKKLLENEKTPFKADGHKVMYQPILGIPEYNSSSRNKIFKDAFEILATVGSFKDKMVLDIGSCYGYFSFGLVKNGAYVTGVERDGGKASICLHLAPLNGFDWSNPKFCIGSIENYLGNSNRRFDYIMMLNVFHLLYGNHDKNVWSIMNTLAERTKYIMLCTDITHPRELCKTQADVPSKVIGNSVLNNYEDYGQFLGDRHLFKFWK